MDRLLEVINSGYISHAYIFIGSKEDLKKKARTVAMALNCESDKNKPCRICSSCLRIQQGIYPDVFEIFPDGKSIGIKKIRNLILSFSKKPVEGKRKTYILYDAHKMTKQAQNSFLKTLEEPATQSTTILVCDNIKKLLPTVVSRCQVYDFSKTESTNLPQDIRWKIADILMTVVTGDYSDISLKACEVLELEYDEEDLLEFYLSFMRDIFILKTNSKADFYNQDLEDIIRQSALKFSIESTINSIKFIVFQLKACKSRGNKNLIWFNLFFKLREVVQSGYRCGCSVQGSRKGLLL